MLIDIPGNQFEPIIPNDEKQRLRKGFFTLATLALISEIPYAFFQYEVTKEGLIALECPEVFSVIAAGVGATLDFWGNVYTISPANNADDSAFNGDSSSLSPVNQRLSSAAFWTSVLTSYSIGAAGGFLGILPYITSENMSDATFYSIASPIGALLMGAGIAYYIGFNANAADDTFRAIEKYFNTNIKPDHSISRTLQALLESLAVVLYRALGFAAIAMSFINALARSNKNDDSRAPQWLLYTFAAITFVGTATNVSLTRVIKTINKWKNSKFATLSAESKENARQALTWIDIYANFNTFSNITMAVGVSMFLSDLTDENNPQHWVTPSIVGGLMVLLTLVAQRELAINEKALKDNPPSATQPLLQGVSENHLTAPAEANPLHHMQVGSFSANGSIISEIESRSSNIENGDGENREVDLFERIKAAKKCFKQIADTFLSNVYIQWFVDISARGGRAARAVAFLYFTNLLSELLGEKFSLLQTIGLALAVAPPNLRNEFLMFKHGMLDIITQKMAEAYVLYANDENAEDKRFSTWIWENSRHVMFTTYNKGALTYTPNEIQNALEKISQPSP